MPYRFDEKAQKVVSDHLATQTKTDLRAQKAARPDDSFGHMQSQSQNQNQSQSQNQNQSQSQSHSRLSNMQKSRGRIADREHTLGTALPQPDLGPLLKKGLIFISIVILIFGAVTFFLGQGSKIPVSKSDPSDKTSIAATFPYGKKPGPATLYNFLVKTGNRARDDGENEAAVALFAQAAEEARLGGASMSKQYIDALARQAETYQYWSSDSAKARPLYEKVLRAQSADGSIKPVKLAATYNGLADALRGEGLAPKEKVLGFYAKAISISKSAGDYQATATYSYNAGDYSFDNGLYDRALAFAKDSINNFARAKIVGSSDIADSLYLAARCHSHLPGPQHVDGAHGAYTAALAIYEKTDSTGESEMHQSCIRDAALNKLKMGKREQAAELFAKAASHKPAEQTGKSGDSYLEEALR